MNYIVATLADLPAIYTIRDEAKARLRAENIAVWLGDYPTDDLIYDDVKNERGRIIKEGEEIVAYAALHLASLEYSKGTFCHDDLYSFSRIMTKAQYAGKGYAKYLISQMFDEVKGRCSGFGIIVDDCNLKAVSLYQKMGFKMEGYSQQIYGNFVNLTYYYNPDQADLINYELASLSQLKTQLFNLKLYKTKYKVLGVTIPNLRTYSKKLNLTYLEETNFKSIEEVLLGGILLTRLSSDSLIKGIKRLLAYTDSWCVTDLIAQSAKAIGKNPLAYCSFIRELLEAKEEFYVRTGIIILLTQFKNIELYAKILELIKNVKLDTYYVNMALAWLLTEMSFKDEKILDYVEKNFNAEVKKMFRQKRRDSLRERKRK